MLAQELIRRKRDGHALTDAEICAFVAGLTSGDWGDGQCAAMAMAILLQGMTSAETVALTKAMTHSGQVMDWSGLDLHGPLLDKHSSGGVGDKVSLLLAPIIAACGGYVPMVSGRGLGHTGGTLDKLECIPGYQVAPDSERLRKALRIAGCAIVGQSAVLAPADRRLYAIRDVTATVESIPLITASILSKKLAAGLQGLVMDVKVGNGAFASSVSDARDLARSLVRVAHGAGLPTRAWITDMNQVLGDNCGNALEVREAVAFLACERQEPRLLEVTLALSAELLQLGGLAADRGHGIRLAEAALRSGLALQHFEKMVYALGGPTDFCAHHASYLLQAPVQLPVTAERSGWVCAMDTRQIGMVVVGLGGGRQRVSDTVDPRVGLANVAPIGQHVETGETLAVIHAASASDAQVAQEQLLRWIQIDDQPVAPVEPMVERILENTE